jgi:PAS domain S-box-containing protein
MLPAGAVVENRPPTLWERERKYVLATIAIIAVLCSLILALLWQRARKRKAEAVLRESEERFRVMADTTPSLIWMCDSKGNVTYLNDRRMTFTGPDPDRSAEYGAIWATYVHPDDVNKVRSAFSRALDRHERFAKEYRLRRYDGVYRWIFDVASPRVNGDGTFAGFIGSAIDITDQKLAQEALEKISGRLIEAQEKERSRIARELHDDICQRLALLSIEIEHVNRDPNESLETANQRLEDIHKRCSGIANDVQSMSHQLHSSKLDYLGVVSAIRSLCREFARQHEVTVEFADENVRKNLPKDISLCLFRVAQEALHNAVKYSGVNEFGVGLKGSATEIRLEVRDSGVGFDVEEAKNNGGLGLVSMAERVHLVRGRFHVESRPGGGTKVVAIAPLVPENNVLPAGPGDSQTTNVVEAA